MTHPESDIKTFIPSRTALVYAVLAGLWIGLSDRAVALLVDDPQLLIQVQTYKGWAFVLVTAIILYCILRQQVLSWEKRTQDLIDREKQYHFLVDKSPLPIFIQTGGSFSYLNSQALNLFRASSQEQMLGKPVIDHVHPDFREKVKQRIQSLNRDKQEVPALEQVFTTIDGKNVDVNVQAVPFNFQGQDGAGVFVQDITGHKKNQEQLRAWHDLMQYIIRHDPSAIAVHDRNMNYIYVSQRYLDDYQVTRDVIGRHHYEVFPEIPDKWRQVHARALQGEVISSDDDHFIRPDGSIDYTRWQCRPWYKADGSIGGIVLYTEVITRLKQTEIQLRELNQSLEQKVRERTARLEELNRELEAFSYSVSHDLRAPLRSIDGFSQALLEDCHDQLDDEGKDYLQRVRSATQRMGHLIDEMLKLSRISKAELKPLPVDLSQLARKVCTELSQENPDHHVDIQIQETLTAQADPALMEILLENLLSNAWKFTKDNPDAAIEVGQKVLDSQEVFFIADNGAGFDMQYAQQLFAPFKRLHSADKYPGTGIGLATCARIVKKHQGRIWADSEPEKGTTFFFTLGGGEN
ncbi:multi-sensor signal transduction histidine kinase [Desulfonatronospira thiodismutans ASO3-1]|uniref:histidine kinase n=1 Tax=Desulfonatronospira thiodismutans ASO3-1 TaxID=555779 RepID=D6SJS0_9BACT|nr:ATP-binding protein [Desulfonatronospira thiodismutans]EFI36123.1 multi-sensor signal transduction histidine kinase [Desulfonatronospira thiodismutans ASO3-1]